MPFLSLLYELSRYCPEKYYPFDPSNLDKYVIGDDYLPTWEVPALKDYYTTLGYSMKDAFDGYLIDSGKVQNCYTFFNHITYDFGVCGPYQVLKNGSSNT